MNLPSRGLRPSATTMRNAGLFFAPTRFKRILTAINHYLLRRRPRSGPLHPQGFPKRSGEPRLASRSWQALFLRIFVAWALRPAQILRKVAVPAPQAPQSVGTFHTLLALPPPMAHSSKANAITGQKDAPPGSDRRNLELPLDTRPPASPSAAIARRRTDLHSAISAGHPHAGHGVPGPNGQAREVPTFVNEFWTATQRQASSLHEISYRACFKPQLPRFFIERLTQPGEWSMTRSWAAARLCWRLRCWAGCLAAATSTP